MRERLFVSVVQCAYPNVWHNLDLKKPPLVSARRPAPDTISAERDHS